MRSEKICRSPGNMAEESIDISREKPQSGPVECAMALLQRLELPRDPLEHAYRVREMVKQAAASPCMEAAALIHDLERVNLINSYEICEMFGPSVMHILYELAAVIWVEKVSSHDNVLSEFAYEIGDFRFVAADLEKGIVLRAVDWIDNKQTSLRNGKVLSISHRKVGKNFYIPLLEYLGYHDLSEQIKILVE